MNQFWAHILFGIWVSLPGCYESLDLTKVKAGGIRPSHWNLPECAIIIAEGDRCDD